MDEQTRIKVLELLEELLAIAEASGMKRRIIDTLQECREQVDAEEEISRDQWARISSRLEDAMQSMEKQIPGVKKEVVINGDVTVSQEEVCRTMTDIWNKSNALNMQSCKGYQRKGVQLCQQAEREMSDWCNARANGSLLTDPEKFKACCIQAGQKYDHAMVQEAYSYIDEMSRQYVHAMDKIRGLIASIDPGQVSLTSKDIYEKWDSRQQERVTRLKKQQEQLNSGGRQLHVFGTTHCSRMHEMVKKAKKIQKALIILPLFILVLTTVLPYIKDSLEDLTMSTEEAASSALETVIVDQAVEAAEAVTGHGIFLAAGLLHASLYVVAAAVYVLWVIAVRKLSEKRLLQELEAYITPRVREFWNGKTLEQASRQYVVSVREHTLQCYDQAFRELFGSIFAPADQDAPPERIRAARLRWERIRK